LALELDEAFLLELLDALVLELDEAFLLELLATLVLELDEAFVLELLATLALELLVTLVLELEATFALELLVSSLLEQLAITSLELLTTSATAVNLTFAIWLTQNDFVVPSFMVIRSIRAESAFAEAAIKTAKNRLSAQMGFLIFSPFLKKW
jgi:hypothetical protein